jgi:transcriptional regulator with GAF, ATPase, and Fis domain/tetratricopeptide (TPR) repeat protein
MGTQTLKAGILIGHRYQVESLLGQGGLGKVYLARDLLEGETQVALKILATPQRINGQGVSLGQGLSLLTRLRHPNLVHILDFGVLGENRSPFLAEEFVEGDDLMRATVGWDTAQIVELLVSVSRVVQYLHSRGIVHQDLKPGNILLPAATADVEKIKVLDFGLAQCVPYTRSHVAAGTLAYTAPELLLGGAATYRSDLYSLGILFYQLLTRRLPFEDEDPGFLIQKHLQGRPDMRPIEVLEHGPRLAQVILGLMEKDPDRRPSSSEDLIRLLRVATARDFVSPRAESHEIYFAAGPFVGRDRELASLKERAVRVLETGRGCTTFVLGESGAGKSRIMEELRTWALLEGWRVVEASCQHTDDRLYPPFREILTRSDRVARALSGADQEIFRFEEMPHLADSSSLNLAADSAAGRFRDLLTREVVRRLTGGPTLVLLHDFHWADEATVAVLDYLSSDILTHPIYLCVSARLIEIGEGPLRKLMEHVPRQGRGDSLALESLSQDSIERLITGVLGEEEIGREIAAWVYKASGGNPFFVEEILKHLVDRGLLRREQGRWRLEKGGLGELEVPASVAIVLRRRIDQLGQLAQEVAAWMAVFGHPISKHLLRNVVSGKEKELDSAISELIRREVIRVVAEGGEESYQFRHSLISEVIRSGLRSRRREQMHRRIGEYLECQKDAERRLQEIALHFTEGRHGEKSVEYAWRAAAACRLEFANEAALRFYEYVLRWATHFSREQMCEVALEAAEVCYSLGVPRRAIRLLEAQLSLIRRGKHPDLRAKLYTKLARSYAYLGNLPLSKQSAQSGLSSMKEVSNSLEKGNIQAGLLLVLALCAMIESRPGKGLKLLNQALRNLEQEETGVLAGHVQVMISALRWLSGDPAGGVAASTRAIQILESSQAAHLLSVAYSHLGICLYALGRLGLAFEKHMRAAMISEQTRSVFQQAQALSNLAECLCRSGRFKNALEIAEKAIKLASETENRDWVHVCTGTVIGIYISIGHYAKAHQALSDLASDASQFFPRYAKIQAHFCAAWLSLELGDWKAASQELDRLERTRSHKVPPYESELGEVLRARICYQSGRTRISLQKLTHLYSKLVKKRRPFQMCVVKLLLAEVLLAEGQLECGRKCARDGLRLARVLPSVNLQAQAHLIMGRFHFLMVSELLSATGVPEESVKRDVVSGMAQARSELEVAHALAQEADAEEILWRVDVELARVADFDGRAESCVLHARKALDRLPSIEARVPMKMLEVFRQLPERDKGRRDCEEFIRRYEVTDKSTETLQIGMIGEAHLRILCRVSYALNGIHELDRLLEAIIDLLIQGIHMERAMVFLKDHETGRLRLAKARNMKRESLDGANHISQSILDEAHKRGHPFVSANAMTDPRVRNSEPLSSSQSGKLLCAPLKARGRTVGVLYADHPDAVESLNESVIDLFAAFCNLSALAIDNALVRRSLSEENAELESHLRQAREGYTEIIGKSAAIETLRERIARAASSPLDILITGESGTGKELVARALHRTGRRSGGKFVPLDCGSLSESLIESELFGYRKGAFTGAIDNRLGLLESANGGVVFFDEISNLSTKLQAKLLRALQEREIRRLGEPAARKVDIQVVAATNQDLREALRRGKFRKDLYYRLNTLEIRVPPIRERMEDIPILVHWFLEKTAATEDGRVKSFSKEAFELLCEYKFPGNVRQLKGIVQGAYYLSPGRTIGREQLPAEIRDSVTNRNTARGVARSSHQLYQEIVQGRGTFKDLVKEPFLRRQIPSSMVRRIIHRALTETRGKYRDAFRILGISDQEYSVTLVFLKRHGCYLNFRRYRRTPRTEAHKTIPRPDDID